MENPESDKDINLWFYSHPVVYFVLLVVSPVIALILYAIITNEPLVDALLHGIVFGLVFAIFTFIFRR